jgi:hypothetical protein
MLRSLYKMKLLRTILLVASVILPPLPLKAIQIIPLSVEWLSTNATLVVHGTVVSKSVQRDPAGRIYTSLDVAVTEVWKGELATNQLTIVRGGGVLGDEMQEVSGEAEYEVGEELVSFLVLNQRGELLSLGMSQGKFHVWREADTGEKLARNNVHGLGPEQSRGVKVSARGTAILNRLTLADLHRRTVGGGK